MNYIHILPTEEQHLVTFWGSSKYANVFEAGAEQDQYFLSQEVKSWLVKNDMKVFVTYGCGDMGGGIPEFSIQFLTAADAALFIDTWSKK